MRGTLAILKKEFRSYFNSPLAYSLIGLFLGIMGLFFAYFVNVFQQRSVSRQPISLDQITAALLQNMIFVFLFFLPLLTMRLFAEEKNQSTLELLLTAPLRTVHLVLGKFFGAMAISLTMVLFTFVYIGFIIAWGNPDLRVLASAYLGMILTLGTFLSFGALISALCSSQAIAGVWTYIGLLLLFVFLPIGQGIRVEWGPIELGPLLVFLSPMSHFNSFGDGLLQLKDVVYFLSFIIFMLFLTHRVVESNRWR